MFFRGILRRMSRNILLDPVRLRVIRCKKTLPPLSQLMVPVPVKCESETFNVGAELTGKLERHEVMGWLAKFYQRREIKNAALENGIDSIYYTLFISLLFLNFNL